MLAFYFPIRIAARITSTQKIIKAISPRWGWWSMRLAWQIVRISGLMRDHMGKAARQESQPRNVFKVHPQPFLFQSADRFAGIPHNVTAS
jgi:bacteriorhodopsin